MLPSELMKECIDKECVISLMTGAETFTGIVKEFETYWMKIQEGNSIRIINGVAVRDIKILSK